MTRYGWSLGRDASSPYASMSSLPEVGDDDFSYITSQDIDDRYADSRHHARSHQSAAADLEDDILLIKNKGVTYPAHFPAYSIGDGKLYVSDVRDRIALMMDLPSRSAKRIKLLYKGKQLKESTMPIRDYGVKNKSEIMAVIPNVDDDSSLSGEESVNLGEASRGDPKSKSRKKRKGKRKPERPDADSPTSPRENGQPFDHPRSPQASSAAAASAPMKKLNGIAEEFETKWLPLCRGYIEAPPTDTKKREEEYRRLSESVLQHILLKLDGVETEGIPAVRARRKELVGQVQGVLKELDTAKSS
ncbi:BAG family molecular chaperone regulator 1A [Escovopsis weberi]|uniref:BAG family molecular chaperone regulator 1A n=1 Tax=Escovopsis weberi TaxID=150374 RepID=A0A0M9VWD3_ESCWE|nr:BAG family molecular chaperone regulator 1A [Escovopsis weberi]